MARTLKGDEVICLEGELGAGKTTFVKGLAQALGIEEGYQVRSPTFTLANVYPTSRGNLIHIDLYRVRDLELEEFLGEGIVAVEWGEGLSLCNLRVKIEFLEDEPEGRRIVIISE